MGSLVELTGATIVGGTLSTTGGGQMTAIGNSTLVDVTIEGNSLDINNSIDVTLQGTINNTGGPNAIGNPECTARGVFEETNASAIMNAVAFNIPTLDLGFDPITGTYTIQPGSALPPITDPVSINGRTQPGWVGDPIIELDGTFAGLSVDGIVIYAGSSTVRGLIINRFDGSGILLNTNGANFVEGSYIGTDVTGTAAAANITGISIMTTINVDPSPTITDDAPALLPLGTTVVTYTATDGSGNTATATQNVTVEDTTSPTVAAPADVAVEGNTTGDATGVALGTPSTTDIVDPSPVIIDDAPAVFPVGTTVVTFTATDASGNIGTANASVTVEDVTPRQEASRQRSTQRRTSQPTRAAHHRSTLPHSPTPTLRMCTALQSTGAMVLLSLVKWLRAQALVPSQGLIAMETTGHSQLRLRSVTTPASVIRIL